MAIATFVPPLSSRFASLLSPSQLGYHAMAYKSRVLSLYKEILRYAQDAKAPAGQPSFVEQARSAFREHISESSAEAIQTLVKKAESKLGYLKVIAPRRRRPTSDEGGKMRFVMKDGELLDIDGSVPRRTAFRDMRIDPDDLARHKRLLEYVTWSRNAHPKRCGFFHQPCARKSCLDT